MHKSSTGIKTIETAKQLPRNIKYNIQWQNIEVLTNSGFVFILLPQINRMQDKITLKTSRKMNKNTPSRRQKSGVDSLLNKKVKTDFVFKQYVFKQTNEVKTNFHNNFVTLSFMFTHSSDDINCKITNIDLLMIIL